jgi:hypothetical protein
MVHQHYRGWHVTMVLDEDSSHTARCSRELANAYHIALLWLPKRSPHLNPMDHLWRDAKTIVCVNWQYASIEQQVDRLIEYLHELPPEDALRKAGVFSQHFWLHKAM